MTVPSREHGNTKDEEEFDGEEEKTATHNIS